MIKNRYFYIASLVTYTIVASDNQLEKKFNHSHQIGFFENNPDKKELREKLFDLLSEENGPHRSYSILARFGSLNWAHVNSQHYDYGSTFLHSAATYSGFKSYEILEFLLKEVKLDPNIQDDHGNTPLHWLRIFEFEGEEREKKENLLISCGADVTIKNKKGDTAQDITSLFYRKK